MRYQLRSHGLLDVVVVSQFKKCLTRFLFPHHIVDFARSYLDVFLVQSFALSPPRPVHLRCWRASERLYQINFDGALLEGKIFLGLTKVARNSDGVYLHGTQSIWSVENQQF